LKQFKTLCSDKKKKNEGGVSLVMHHPSALNVKTLNFVHIKIEASSIYARMEVRCILPTL